jgi:hypothetical protein
MSAGASAGAAGIGFGNFLGRTGDKACALGGSSS